MLCLEIPELSNIHHLCDLKLRSVLWNLKNYLSFSQE